MDLPCDDAAAGFGTYAEVVCADLEGCDDDVIVVGHSMGRHTIPLVAARRPVRHLVYLCALVPDIGRSLADQMRDEPDMMCPGWDAALSEPDDQLRTTWVNLNLTRALLYADCDEPTVIAAVKRLRQQANCLAAPFALAEFPAVSSTFVVCSEDRMLGWDWAKRIARDRLDAEVIELPGSHSPFLSRPSTLAEVLVRLADEVAVALT
jgi:pimeloyl-ACP methyl ester carboxylesterase